MQKEHVRVLLAISPETPVHEIEEQLEQTIRLDCHLFQCTDLNSCLSRLHEDSPHFDIILLDLTFVTNQESENFLWKIQKAAPEVPIIVFTREEDRDLGLFMIQEGASVISNLRNYKLEKNRLRDVIEHSWIQHKKSQLKTRNHADALNAEKDQSAKDLAAEKKEGARRLREKDQVISWMGGGYSVEPSSEQKTKD